MSNTSEQSQVDRSERVMSHALVELRSNNWWPFGVKSAVLLDLSASGFKIELTGPADIKLETIHLLTIPLRPFGKQLIPGAVVCRCYSWTRAAK